MLLKTHSAVFLATAHVTVIGYNGESMLVRELLDQGSEISIIFENLVQRLHLQRQSSSLPIVGVGGHNSNVTRGIASFSIQPHFSPPVKISMQAHILPKITSLIPSVRNAQSYWPHLKGLLPADPSYSKPRKIELLIGADLYAQLLEGSIVKGPDYSPVAQLTKLGWIISGPTNVASDSQSLLTHRCSVDKGPYSLIERFWIQEEVLHPSNKELSPENRECENHFATTHSRDQLGKFTVRFHFKVSTAQLGNSKPFAYRMLSNLLKRFDSDLHYVNLYRQFFEKYKSLGHMIRVPDDEVEPTPNFYIPHHGIIKESGNVKKFRAVFNGSCQAKDGLSLNDAVQSGPRLQTDVFNVLVWSRQFKYIFSCDIEKMYRQVNVHPDDQQFQRVLWIEEGKITVYQLTTVTYGLSCAPYLAMRAIAQLNQDDGDKFPLAKETLINGRYVDDLFGGDDSVEEAQRKVDAVNDMCNDIEKVG